MEELSKRIGALEREVRSKLATLPFLAPGRTTATFKARVQRAGRISIPEAERATLGIEEGDLVQVMLTKLEKPRTKK